MFDELFDLFDRDRRSRRPASSRRGLRGVSDRITGEVDGPEGAPPARARRPESRRADAVHHGDDDARPGSRRGKRDRFDFDV